VLPYLDVPRDVPLNPKLIETAYKRSEAANDVDLEDFSSVDFTAQPDSTAQSDLKADNLQPSVTVALDEGDDIVVPDFIGKTMRDVTENCLRLGLDPVLVGSGRAAEQAPTSGARVRRGAKITVRFGQLDEQAVKPNGKTRNR
jgi:hypothetical protein